MLRIFVTFLVINQSVFCYSQDSIPLYLEISKFKTTEKLIIVNPPFDTLESLSKVPPDQIKTVTIFRNDTFFVRTVSYNLFTAKEPVYKDNAKLKRNYRFTWLRSFDKQIVISLRRENQFAVIETKWFNYKGIKRTATKLLPMTKLKEFEALLATIGFWQESRTFIREGLHIDGSNWIVEAKKGDKYSLLYAYTPTSIEKIRKIGEWLIKNSDASGERIF
jgi:hypothetical protein